MEEPENHTLRASTYSTWDFSMDRIIPLGSRGWGGWRSDSAVGLIHDGP